MKKRYELIIWDGCGMWAVELYFNRELARRWKNVWLDYKPVKFTAKIYDRKLKKFIY